MYEEVIVEKQEENFQDAETKGVRRQVAPDTSDVIF